MLKEKAKKEKEKKSFNGTKKKKNNIMDQKEMELVVLYGANQTFVNVTLDVLFKCMLPDGSIVIPHGNHRQDQLFGDPLHGVVKEVRVLWKHTTNPQTNDIELSAESLAKCLQQPFASLLRQKCTTVKQFAMQLAMYMHCGPKDRVLHVGAKSGVNFDCITFANIAHVTYVEPNIDLVANIYSDFLPQVTVVPRAFSYQPLVLYKQKYIPMYEFEKLIKTPQNPVQIHTSLDHSMLEQKSSLDATQAGVPTCTLEMLEERQDPFTVLIFENIDSLFYALQDAAPRVLHHARKVIVCASLAHNMKMTYCVEQLRTFMFRLTYPQDVSHDNSNARVWQR